MGGGINFFYSRCYWCHICMPWFLFLFPDWLQGTYLTLIPPCDSFLVPLSRVVCWRYKWGRLLLLLLLCVCALPLICFCAMCHDCRELKCLCHLSCTHACVKGWNIVTVLPSVSTPNPVSLPVSSLDNFVCPPQSLAVCLLLVWTRRGEWGEKNYGGGSAVNQV